MEENEKMYIYKVDNTIYHLKDDKYIYCFLEVKFNYGTEWFGKNKWLKLGFHLEKDQKHWNEEINTNIKKLNTFPMSLIASYKIKVFYKRHILSTFSLGDSLINGFTADIVILKLCETINRKNWRKYIYMQSKLLSQLPIGNYYVRFISGRQGFLFTIREHDQICVELSKKPKRSALTTLKISDIYYCNILYDISIDATYAKREKKDDQLAQKINLYIGKLEFEFSHIMTYNCFFEKLEKIKNHPDIIPLYQELQYLFIFKEKDYLIYNDIVKKILPYIQNDDFIRNAEFLEPFCFPSAPIFDITKMELEYFDNFQTDISHGIEFLSKQTIQKETDKSNYSNNLISYKKEKINEKEVKQKNQIENKSTSTNIFDPSYIFYYRGTNGIFYTLKEENKSLNNANLRTIHAKHMKKFAYLSSTEEMKNRFDFLIVDIDLQEEVIHFLRCKNAKVQKLDIGIIVDKSDFTFHFRYQLNGILEIFARITAVICNKVYYCSGRQDSNYFNGSFSEVQHVVTPQKLKTNHSNNQRKQIVTFLEWKEESIKHSGQYPYFSSKKSIESREKKVYIRRGHWHSYWYGARNSLDRCKRLRWVEDTIVNRGLTENVVIKL